MRKTVTWTSLLINWCPILVPGQRRRVKNEIFSFSPLPLSVLLPHSPAIMNSLLGPNYIQGCIRSTAGPVETSAEFSLIPSLPAHAVTLLEMAFTWLNFECLPPHCPTPPYTPTHTFPVVLYLRWVQTHMWFMMEAGGNVLLAVLHFIAAPYDREGK